MRPIWIILFVMAFVTVSDVFALGVGSGGVARSRRNRSKNGSSSKDDKEKTAEETHKKHVEQMPPAENIPDLDTSDFNRVDGKLDLTKDQSDKIDEAKRKIQEKISQLKKNQEEARKSFENAKEDECPAKAVQMNAAAQACKIYNPHAEFASALASILSRDQRLKMQELSKR